MFVFNVDSVIIKEITKIGSLNMGKSIKVFALLFVLLAVVSCTNKENYYEGKGKVVANINGYKVTEGKLNKIIESMPQNAKAQYEGKEGRKKLLDQLVVQKLLVQEAKKMGLDKNPDFLIRKEMDEDSLLIEQYYKHFLDSHKLDDKTLKKYYQENADKFAPPEQFEAYHILITPEKDQKVFNTKKSDAKNEKEAKKKIAMIQKLLKKGVSFEKVAKEYSEGPSAPRGGYLGKFSLGRMIPEFENALKKMKPGDISEPVKTRFGYHIIYLKDRKKGEPTPFEKLSEQEKNKIKQEYYRDLLNKKIEELKAKAKIKIEE